MRLKAYFWGAVVGYLSHAAAFGETVVSQVDEKITVGCECMRDIPLCELEVFAGPGPAGKPTHSWNQDNYLKAKVPADLDAACYRARDSADLGDGLCCSIPEDETKTIKNLFRGKKL